MIASREPIRPEAVAGHYDELDRFYREIWGEHVHHGLWNSGSEDPQEACRQLVQHVANEAGVCPGDVVCDIGCGYGATAEMLANDWKADVTGITISARQHAYCKKLAGDRTNPEFKLGDWLRNDLPPD